MEWKEGRKEGPVARIDAVYEKENLSREEVELQEGVEKKGPVVVL